EAQVPRHRERPAADDAARLEGAVADRQPEVERAEQRLRGVAQPSVRPDDDPLRAHPLLPSSGALAPAPSDPPPRGPAHAGPSSLARATSRAALTSVSAHSRSGSDSHAIPAPVPKRSVPLSSPVRLNVRMA